MSELRATDDLASVSTPARRFRFSMRGLLVCIFGIAFGLGNAHTYTA